MCYSEARPVFVLQVFAIRIGIIVQAYTTFLTAAILILINFSVLLWIAGIGIGLSMLMICVVFFEDRLQFRWESFTDEVLAEATEVRSLALVLVQLPSLN
jgi:hypothetical protein